MRASSRVFFAKPASLAWLLCWLCALALNAASASHSLRGESLCELIRLPRRHRSSAAHKSAAQQRLPGQTPPKYGALQGLVRGANGRPVLGATVILRNVVTGQSLQKISNAQGVFRFIDVLPGTYDLNVVGVWFQGFHKSRAPAESRRQPGVRSHVDRASVTAVAVGSFPSSQPGPQILPKALNPRLLPMLRPPRWRTKLSNRPVSRLRNSRATSTQRYFNRNPTAGPLPCPIGTATASAASTRT